MLADSGNGGLVLSVVATEMPLAGMSVGRPAVPILLLLLFFGMGLIFDLTAVKDLRKIFKIKQYQCLEP